MCINVTPPFFLVLTLPCVFGSFQEKIACIDTLIGFFKFLIQFHSKFYVLIKLLLCVLYCADGDIKGEGAKLTVFWGKMRTHMGMCIFDSMISNIQFRALPISQYMLIKHLLSARYQGVHVKEQSLGRFSPGFLETLSSLQFCTCKMRVIGGISSHSLAGSTPNGHFTNTRFFLLPCAQVPAGTSTFSGTEFLHLSSRLPGGF